MTHHILNLILYSVLRVTTDEYDQKLYMAVFRLAFSVFARTGLMGNQYVHPPKQLK